MLNVETRLMSENRWSISAIVLWEIATLSQKGRIAMDLEDPAVVRALSRIHVWPLTREVALASTRLDIKGDPADPSVS